MKVIVSHDIDHINVTEHYKDLIIPKFILRNLLEFSCRSISLRELVLRNFGLVKNKWQNILELNEFNQSFNVPATYFIGVNNGKGLSYSLKTAEKWIKKLENLECEIGVHGIDYDDLNKVSDEFDIFRQLTKTSDFGIRMHYLRSDINTLKYLSQAGYKYDSTELAIKDVYKIGSMFEFPLHIMDGVVCGNRKYGNKKLEDAQKETLEIISQVEKKNCKYLTILFHDRYFDNSFKIWKEWYIWLIQYLNDNKYEFISYKDAIKEIE